MMVSRQSVLNRLRQFITLDEQGAENALPLCEICLSQLTERLRDDADENDMRIAEAAAGLAYYRLMLRAAASDSAVESFRAGDVTVTRSPAAVLEIAAKIRNEALAGAAPLIKDDNFFFGQVEI